MMMKPVYKVYAPDYIHVHTISIFFSNTALKKTSTPSTIKVFAVLDKSKIILLHVKTVKSLTPLPQKGWLTRLHDRIF